MCLVQKAEEVDTIPASLHKIMVEIHMERKDLIKSEFKELELKSFTSHNINLEDAFKLIPQSVSSCWLCVLGQVLYLRSIISLIK